MFFYGPEVVNLHFITIAPKPPIYQSTTQPWVAAKPSSIQYTLLAGNTNQQAVGSPKSTPRCANQCSYTTFCG